MEIEFEPLRLRYVPLAWQFLVKNRFVCSLSVALNKAFSFLISNEVVFFARCQIQCCKFFSFSDFQPHPLFVLGILFCSIRRAQDAMRMTDCDLTAIAVLADDTTCVLADSFHHRLYFVDIESGAIVKQWYRVS